MRLEARADRALDEERRAAFGHRGAVDQELIRLAGRPLPGPRRLRIRAAPAPDLLESVQQEGETGERLVTEIAKALVDIPEEVTVREVQGEQVTVLELRVAPSDLGKVIGKQGRTARSIRTLLGAAGMKLNRRFTLEILE